MRRPSTRTRVLVIATAIVVSATIAYANFTDLDLTPNGTTTFGPIGAGSSDTKSFMLHNENPGMTDDIGWTFAGPGSGAFKMITPCTSVNNGEPCTSLPLTGDQIIPAMIQCSSSTPGTYTATISAQTLIGGNPAGDAVQLSCTVNGGGGGSLIITPAMHGFGTVDVDTTSPAFAFDLENDTGIDPLGSIGLQVGSGFLLGSPCPDQQSCTIATILPQGGHMPIEVKCAPTSAGGLSDSLTITSGAFSDTAGITCMGVPGTGTGPELSLSTSLIDIAAPFGGMGTQMVTMTNEGDADLVITLTVGGAHPDRWFVTPSSCLSQCTITPTDPPIVVAFRFSPDVVGDESASVRFQTNDPDDGEGDFTVALTGTGTGGVLGPAAPMINFGQVRIGNSGAGSFAVGNTGILTDLMVTTSTAAPFAIAPPTTAMIQVGSPATFFATCTPTAETTYSDDIVVNAPQAFGPTSQTVPVQCEGVISDVTISPTSAYDFGGVRLGTTASKDFTVTNVSAAGVPYVVPTVAAPFHVVAPTGGGSLAPQASVVVTVEFTPTSEDPVELPVTGLIPAEPGRVIDVQGHGTIAAYTVTPAMVDLGTACVGDSVSTPVTLRVTGTSVLHVEAPTVAGDAVFRLDSVAPGPLPRDLTPDESVDADVVATPAIGEHRATLVWATDLTANDQTAVTLSVAGIEQGLAASPGAIDFGETSAAEPASRPIRVRVCAIEALSVSARLEGDPGFVLAGPSAAMVTALESQPWTVVFSPARRGDQHAVLHLVPEAGPPIDIELDGSNVDAEVTNYYSCGCNADTSGAGGAMIAVVLMWQARRRRRRTTR